MVADTSESCHITATDSSFGIYENWHITAIEISDIISIHLENEMLLLQIHLEDGIFILSLNTSESWNTYVVDTPGSLYITIRKPA